MPGVQEAIALIKAGNREGASRSWPNLLAQDPTNETAWLWMSSVVERDDQRRYCLKQILKHNLTHALARSALANLDGADSSQIGAQVGQPAADSGAVRESRPLPNLRNERHNRAARLGRRLLPPAGLRGHGTSPSAGGGRDSRADRLCDSAVGQNTWAARTSFTSCCELTGMSWPDAESFVHQV